MLRPAVKDILPAVFCLLAAALLIAYAPAASAGAVRGIAACGSVILPAVFPFLAVSVFLAGAPGGTVLARAFSGVAVRCYRLPPAAAPAILMSWIGGYPAGAKTLAELQKRGAVTARQAQQGAALLIHSGPAYMAGVVGQRIFGSVAVGLFLFLCQLAAGLLTARLLTLGQPRPRPGGGAPVLPKAEPAAVLLVRSVGSAAASAVNICAFVVLLSAFSAVLAACGVFPLLAKGLAALSGGRLCGTTADCLLTGLLEICAGSAMAARLPPAEAAKILPFLLSFGGISICCQVAACLGETGLPWGRLLLSRLLHGLLTALLALPWLGRRAAVPAMTGAAVPALSLGRMLWGSLWMLVLCGMLAARWERGLPKTQ